MRRRGTGPRTWDRRSRDPRTPASSSPSATAIDNRDVRDHRELELDLGRAADGLAEGELERSAIDGKVAAAPKPGAADRRVAVVPGLVPVAHADVLRRELERVGELVANPWKLVEAERADDRRERDVVVGYGHDGCNRQRRARVSALRAPRVVIYKINFERRGYRERGQGHMIDVVQWPCGGSPNDARTQAGTTALTRSERMNLKLRRLVVVAALLSLGACVVYEPIPVSSQPTLQQRFDRSWAAAAGAMSDQGLTITSQDRGSGVIQGERGGTTVTATLQTLADGRIQVTFNSKGADSTAPGLVQRVSDSYDRRMGR